MPHADLDVVCIGNAIVDILAQAKESDIERLDLTRGAMTLIDAERAQDLYRQMGPAMEASGGSAANTAAGIASLGGAVAYVGKVRDDQFGGVFTHDIRASGVEFTSQSANAGPPTARCLIFITPDAQRTMNTYLGACVNLTSDDIDSSQIARAKVTYMEGYLWDRDEAKQAYLKAAAVSHEYNRQVSITLSDSFCVERHRDSFRELIRSHVDILFANEAEIMSLYQVDSFDAAMQHVRAECQIAALTRSEHGSVVLAGDEVHVVDAVPVSHVADTTGAGDQYAAGFLYGLTHGQSLAECGHLGSIAAAEVIAHIGPRPEVKLSELVAKQLPAHSSAQKVSSTAP
ncbi:MAG: adenosine kinase [Alphaproteobacteria bacterium]